jgi:predicted membrane-bound spermidine synthase
MTIGLDITSMGFGALMLDPVVTRLRSGRQHDGPEGVAAFAQRLFVIECLLMMCGLLAVPFVLWCDRLDLTLMMGSVLGGYLKVMVLHFPIVVIGILSGLELPLLMSCAKPLRDGSKDATVPPSSSSFDSGTLAWDYVGTVGGALLFPFFLLPRFGVFGVAGLVVLSNAATTLLSWLSCSITHI